MRHPFKKNWTLHNDDQILNINVLRNQTMVNGVGRDLYLFTPCCNGIECDYGDNKTTNVMAAKYDMNSGKCMETVAV